MEENKELSGINLSNLEVILDKTFQYAQNLTDLWDNSKIEGKRKLQKMVFPEGLGYDFKNGYYRTPRVNGFFELTHSLSKNLEENKKGQNIKNDELSSVVAGTRLELVTFGL